MAPRIVSGAKTPTKLPIKAGERPRPSPKISFSFQYWQQMRYFGLDQAQRDWFVGLLDRLRVASEMTRDQWDGTVHGPAWRYHRVDWNAKAIPISKDELNWVPKVFRDNNDDFPIYQFGLGAGQGRVAGFWETNDRFAIILLDPHHNLQPSGNYGYKVTDCAEQPSPAALVHLAVDHVRVTRKCQQDDCNVHQQLATIAVRKKVDGAYFFHEVISIGLEEQQKKDAEELLAAGHVSSMADIVKKGIDALVMEWQEADKQAPDSASTT